MSRPRKQKSIPPDRRAYPPTRDEELAAKFGVFLNRGHPDDPENRQHIIREKLTHWRGFARACYALSELMADPLNDAPELHDIIPFMFDCSGERRRIGSDGTIENEDALQDRMLNVFSELLLKPEAEMAASFTKIVQLRKNIDALYWHRNVWAFQAYITYIEENGVEPTKCELKRFILKDRCQYPDAPAPGDLKGWLRVWENSGLKKLERGAGEKMPRQMKRSGVRGTKRR